MVLFLKHSYNIIKDKGLSNFLLRFLKYFFYLINNTTKKIALVIANFFSNRHSEQLNKILSKHNDNTIIIILGTHSWFYPMFQRPPQLAKSLAKKNCSVFYCFRFPTKNVINGFYKLVDNCYLTHRLDLLLKLELKKVFYTLSYDTDTPLFFLLDQLEKGNTVIYDYLDEIHPDVNQIEIDNSKIEKHQKILSNERFIVIATAEKLYQEVGKFRKNKKYLIPNAADLKHFSQKKEIHFSSKFSSILHKKKPIIGYYGTIAKWIDFDLLIYLAEHRQQYEFILIGLVGDNSIYDYNFRQLENFNLHKPVKYEELPFYANKFDVLIIPFRKYSVTEATSPIKLFEYMAIRKPIVSTDLNECKKFESVLIAENYEKFADMIDYGLKIKVDDVYYEKMRKEANENDWNHRADRILEIISGKI